MANSIPRSTSAAIMKNLVQVSEQARQPDVLAAAGPICRTCLTTGHCLQALIGGTSYDVALSPPQGIHCCLLTLGKRSRALPQFLQTTKHLSKAFSTVEISIVRLLRHCIHTLKTTDRTNCGKLTGKRGNDS